jgi:hypothetical protein
MSGDNATQPDTRPSEPARRKLWRLLLLLPAIPLLGAWPLWLLAADRLESGLETWVRQQETRGTAVQFRGPVTTGFPLVLETRLGELDIRRHDGWRWQSPHLETSFSLTDRDRLLIELAPLIAIEPPPQWQAQDLELRAGAPIEGTAYLDDPEQAFDIALAGQDVTLETEELSLSAQRADLRLAARREGLFSGGDHFLSLAVRDIRIPPFSEIPLEGPISRAEIALRILGDLSGTRRRDAAHWRDAGGAVELQALRLVWQDLELELASPARLRLDAELRPLGTLEIKARGLDRLLDRLERAGRMSAEQALGLRFLILAMTRVEAGAAPFVRLPVSFRQGQLYLGPQLVGRIPPLP